MYPDQIIFTIPIYLKSEENYLMDLKKRAEKHLEAKRKINENAPSWLPHLDEEFIINQFYKFNSRPWKYNFIIGWIEFYLCGETIKASYWLVNSKKISYTLVRKEFRDCGKIADVSLTHTKNNSEIKDDVKRFLVDLAEGKYKPEFIKFSFDTEEFLLSLEYLDLKALISSYF
ncbi:MAG: hypothetical protein A3F83_00225 [Candidatus Glassbacteria bacterium RIFCSPLOWO2_12_FULL_58_11]|uniref:Uncharacterized protein n=1 Tax=Candidatus Glassbacteria bacterium RIFCSPLOWO2_12_FULL_58_11 TaxID=1817867 RepID=A0A1F5YX22_9BACT|nr:MAG: hypothetical protein A3F83_00225 [Candidatus Glassbacteria bacterium RIFCSPLOWO2_12_FULL_58_11]